MDNLACTLPW